MIFRSWWWMWQDAQNSQDGCLYPKRMSEKYNMESEKVCKRWRKYLKGSNLSYKFRPRGKGEEEHYIGQGWSKVGEESAVTFERVEEGKHEMEVAEYVVISSWGWNNSRVPRSTLWQVRMMKVWAQVREEALHLGHHQEKRTGNVFGKLPAKDLQ